MPQDDKFRTRTKGGEPNPVDIHVGARIRQQRRLMGMSQKELGSALGLTFQQVQKYENGSNRVGPSRLYGIACFLKVPVGFFFDNMPDEIGDHAPRPLMDEADHDTVAEKLFDDLHGKRELLDWTRAYYRIADLKLRKKIYDLLKALGELRGGDLE